MANLPRWINCAQVDSTAMVLAYTEWVSKGRDRNEEDPLLHEERHRPVVEIGKAMTIEIPWKFCTQKGCYRCGARRGGYKF